jgi:carboxylesterase
MKSEKDDVADPVSAVLIYKGTKASNGTSVNVKLISSDLHVFTRLSARNPTPTTTDFLNQTNAFNEISNLLIQ